MLFGLKEIWGIDLGSSAIKVVKLVKVKGQVVITDFELLKVEEIEGYEGEEEEYYYEKIKRTLLRAVNRKHLQNSKVAIVLPGHSAIVKKIQFPTLDPKRVEKMVNFEAAQQIPFPLEEVVWDYQMLGVADSGAEYEVSLFAIKKGLVNRYLSILEEAELDVELLQVSSMALYNFINYDMPPEEGENVIMLDMGHDNSDLVICAGRNFLIRNIPTAGDDITKAFQRKFSVTTEEAENIKLELTDSKQSQKLFTKVVEPILHDLVGDMQRTINYFSSQYSGVTFTGILTSGGPFQMPGALQFVADRLQLGIINIDELESLSVHLRDVDYFYEILPRMPLAIGAGLQALSEGPVQVNLLPSDIRFEKVFEKKKPVAIIGLIVVLLTMIFSYWVSTITRDFQNNVSLDCNEIITISTKYEKKCDKLKKETVPVQTACERMSHLDGLLKGIDKDKTILSRYAHGSVWNDIIKIIEQFKYNNPAKEEESLWIDQVVIEKIPHSWESVLKKVQTGITSGDSRELNLGDIETFLKPKDQADTGGRRLGGRARRGRTQAAHQAVTKKLLFCHLRGRTRKGMNHFVNLKNDIDGMLKKKSLLFKSGRGTVGGHNVQVRQFVDEMKHAPTMGAGGGAVDAAEVMVIKKRYLIFDIVWICRLEPESAKPAAEKPSDTSKPKGKRSSSRRRPKAGR
jgi:type IV pilus assembly protein PilM